MDATYPLKNLFEALADVLDTGLAIEQAGRSALLDAKHAVCGVSHSGPLPQTYLDIFDQPDANPVCAHIRESPFSWAPPQTSDDPKYIADSVAKAHIELIGPDGLVHSDNFRMGLYGMLPGYEYGIRTHLAEEVFVMLAGEADWRKGDGDYQPLRAGDRSYHPSMMPHANRTRDQAFMSIYIWRGDVSTDSYVYSGSV